MLVLCLFAVVTVACRSAGPALSEAEPKALMGRQRQAEEAFQQALASQVPGRQEELYRQVIGLVPDMGEAHNGLMGKPIHIRSAVV